MTERFLFNHFRAASVTAALSHGFDYCRASRSHRPRTGRWRGLPHTSEPIILAVSRINRVRDHARLGASQILLLNCVPMNWSSARSSAASSSLEIHTFGRCRENIEASVSTRFPRNKRQPRPLASSRRQEPHKAPHWPALPPAYAREHRALRLLLSPPTYRKGRRNALVSGLLDFFVGKRDETCCARRRLVRSKPLVGRPRARWNRAIIFVPRDGSLRPHRHRPRRSRIAFSGV